MRTVTRLGKASYALALAFSVICLLGPNSSHGQFPGSIPLQPMNPGLTASYGMMGMGGGMMGFAGMGGMISNPLMASNLLQTQLMLELGAIPLNGMSGGMMGLGAGMMGMGGFSMGGASMMGMGSGFAGNNPNLLQMQLLSDFGAIPANGLGGGSMMGMGGIGGMMMGMSGGMMGMGGGGMAGFAGKGAGGFNGRHGI